MKKLIGERLEEVFETWTEGWAFLITDDLISFYSFFTVIFAECAYLWSHYETKVAIPFTVILLGYVVNVIVTAWFKAMHEGERKEVVFVKLYNLVFVALAIIGCCFDVWLSIGLIAIPLIVTAVCIVIRECQDTYFVDNSKSIAWHINKLFGNKVFWWLSQFVIIGGPFIAFVVYLTQIPTLATTLKIIIPIVYAICIPFIVFLEDYATASNIFGLAYEITWSEEYEERMNKPIHETMRESDESD